MTRSPGPGHETVVTYRYVRVSIVGVVVLLFTALLIEVAGDSWDLLPSISAYFYTPVRSVFVGSLVAAAFLLVAVRGRPGLEDGLLNLGGMLLPVVAFVPTPVSGQCPTGGRCIPDEFVPGVEVSMGALLIVGLGHTGRELARKARAFGMHVIGTKRHPSPVPDVERVGGGEGSAQHGLLGDQPLDTAGEQHVVALLLREPEERAWTIAQRIHKFLIAF